MNTELPKRLYKLTIAYDGTPFRGWQRQGELPTVQLAIEHALKKCWGYPITLHGSGRTDTGVHALGQVAHFEAEKKFDTHTVVRALNHNLPPSVQVLKAYFAPEGFHARFWAIGKVYIYRIWNAPIFCPFEVNRSYFIPQELDLKGVRKAAKYLVGRHDFASFTSNPGYVRKGTVRVIHDIRFTRKGSIIEGRFHGNGFMYRMVRNLIGALVRVGLNKMKPEEVAHILAAKKRMAAPNTAPACGLYLAKVLHGKCSVPKPFEEDESC